MTTTTATAPTTFVFPDPTKPLDIITHLYLLDKALHAGGDAAVEIYETQTLLTDYSNGAAVRVFDNLESDCFTNWDEVEATAKWLKIDYTPQLVADIRALCKDSIETRDAWVAFTPGPEEQHAERWVMQAEALLAN